MIHAICVQEFYDGNVYYRFFETTTESFFSGHRENLKALVNDNGLSISNLRLLNEEVMDKPWYNKTHTVKGDTNTGADYILLCKTSKNEFKLVSFNDKITYVDGRQLKELTNTHKIANCNMLNGMIKSTDTYNGIRKPQFVQDITRKYELYSAKSGLLGRKMSFDYIIEGNQVKLKRYTGTDKNVILPSFITSITQRAFARCYIETITLNEGLKYIGFNAFEACNLAEITIPETVEFMGLGVFEFNKRLLENDSEYGKYRQDKVKILNKKATILDMNRKNINIYNE